jgi:hypothetical protein
MSEEHWWKDTDTGNRSTGRQHTALKINKFYGHMKRI